MADFCRQCSLELFGEDHRELADLGRGEPLEPGMAWSALCEGCGPTLVDDDGRCVALWCERHSDTQAERLRQSEN